MSDLETRMGKFEDDLEKVNQKVDKVDNRLNKLELTINSSLGDIKTDVAEIKSTLMSFDKSSELKNQLIEKDVISNNTRISKLEENQSKLVWAIIMEVLGVVAGSILAVIKSFGV